MIFTFHDKPIGYWFSVHFDRTVKCPCCNRPGVALRFPRERERRLWAHSMDAHGWLDVCERRLPRDSPGRVEARNWLAARWRKSHKPVALALELGLNVQALASIHAGRMPLARSLPAVREAFAKVGIPSERWDAPPLRRPRLAFLAVFPRTPRVGLDATAGGC